MLKCAECVRIATHFPMVCIPGIGRSDDVGECIQFPVDRASCEEHARRFDPQSLLSSAGPEFPDDTLGQVLERHYRCDTTRAFTKAIKMDSPQARQLKQQQQLAKLTGAPAGHA